MNRPMALVRSLTLRKVPRWMAWRQGYGAHHEQASGRGGGAGRAAAGGLARTARGWLPQARAFAGRCLAAFTALPRIGEGGRVRELAGVLRALTGKAGRNSMAPGFRNGSG
jgi:hypothetical protein